MRYVYLRYAKLNLPLRKGGFGVLSFKVLQINNERNNLSAIPFYELNSRLELEDACASCGLYLHSLQTSL